MRRLTLIVILNPRFWWRLREWWHSPHSYCETMRGAWPRRLTLKGDFGETRDEMFFENIGFYIRTRKHKLWRDDLKQAFRSIYWHALAAQPLCCQGNKGGWQTRLCEWLENQARGAESLKYYYYTEDDF